MQPYGLPDAPNSTLSMILGIVGLVVSFLGCCGFFSVIPLGLGIAAVILGVNARGKITAAQGAFGGSGKAMAGIVTGAVAIGIAVVLFIIALAIGANIRSIVNAIPTPT